MATISAQSAAPPRAPGFRWVMILAAAGFAAGFFGPLVFVPDANQGPLVGILISGPAGLVAGLALYALCSLFKVPARAQWRLLWVTTVVGVIVVLIFVQPQPALRGYLYEVRVSSCAAPIETESARLDDWQQRIEQVTWSAPKAGWQRDMHEALRDAPGVVVGVELLRQNSVMERRKPWNRGRIFATGWKTQSEQREFYQPHGACAEFPPGRTLRGFVKYDLDGRIEPPRQWPPTGLTAIIGASTLAPVPEDFSRF